MNDENYRMYGPEPEELGVIYTPEELEAILNEPTDF